jgi:type IV pilus assembly protein PilN
MPTINLLPWREKAKQQREQKFYAVLGGAFLVALLIVGGVMQVIGSQIELQQTKNDYLNQEIAIVNQQIAEIKALRETKANLKKRMDLVERLQNTRNLPTYLFDSLAKIVSPGVYLERVERKGGTIWIQGLSESNNHLANTIRNVETSPWYRNPLLQNINARQDRLRQLNKFSMRIEIINQPMSGVSNGN